jgi:C-terminal processing protease CtpA/Prc
MKLRSTAAWALCLLLLLNGLSVLGQQRPQEDRVRIERLVALCKLWSAVKFFHPYLAYRNDIDWDKALVEIIPQVDAARDGSEYANAVQHMLQALGDPATHIVPKSQLNSVPAEPRGERNPDPSFQQLPDGTLLVNMAHYADLLDFSGMLQRAAAVSKEIPKARAVLIDLRPTASLREDDRGMVADAFDLGRIANILCSSKLAPPGERRRMHVGFVPQQGGTSGGYESAFYTALGPTIAPDQGAKDVPVVFLVNENSELPVVALALQGAGKGAIVAEGNVGDASAVTTQRLPLGDGLQAQIRLGELLYEDGTAGLQPDLTVPVSRVSGEQNPAFQQALALARNFKTSATPRKRIPASATTLPDKPYEEMSYPPVEYRVLAAFRIWAVINYFFPYKDLMGEDWDDVLREFISRMEKASNALEYNLAVAEMVTHIHDGHGNVRSPTLSNYFGASPAPVRVRMIERLPVITDFLNEQAARAAGAELGDVILKVDGEDAKDRLARLAKYISASTTQWQMYRTANYLLSGPEDSLASVIVRDLNDRVKELKLPRYKAYNEGATSLGESTRLQRMQRTGEVTKWLPGNIGYADLDRLTVPMVDAMFEKFKDAKAIILDDRTYPHGTAWAIAPRLTDKDSVVAAMFQRRVAMFPDAPISDLATQFVTHTFFQQIPNTDKWRYKGKTVMLIDERTKSQAEHTGLFLEAANGTKFVGSPTAGANGDVTNFCVPGGIWIWFSGQAVRHADGRQLQRVGLEPDVEVQPTLKGIREGKDEVLQKAIEYLQHELR